MLGHYAVCGFFFFHALISCSYSDNHKRLMDKPQMTLYQLTMGIQINKSTKHLFLMSAFSFLSKGIKLKLVCLVSMELEKRKVVVYSNS